MTKLTKVLQIKQKATQLNSRYMIHTHTHTSISISKEI